MTANLSNFAGTLDVSTLGLFYETMSRSTIETVSALKSFFDYSGFNPETFHQALLEYGRNATPQRTDAQIGSDIATMILLFLRRGSKISKVANKSSPDARARINDLIRIYRIVDANNRTPNCVTLLRVCSAYPPLVMRIAKRYPPKNALGLSFKSPKHLLSLPGAAGCIPKGEPYTDALLGIVNDYQDRLNEQFGAWESSGTMSRSATTPTYERGRFTKLAHDGPVEGYIRVRVLQDVGILDTSGQLALNFDDNDDDDNAPDPFGQDDDNEQTMVRPDQPPGGSGSRTGGNQGGQSGGSSALAVAPATRTAAIRGGFGVSRRDTQAATPTLSLTPVGSTKAEILQNKKKRQTRQKALYGFSFGADESAIIKLRDNAMNGTAFAPDDFISDEEAEDAIYKFDSWGKLLGEQDPKIVSKQMKAVLANNIFKNFKTPVQPEGFTGRTPINDTYFTDNFKKVLIASNHDTLRANLEAYRSSHNTSPVAQLNIDQLVDIANHHASDYIGALDEQVDLWRRAQIMARRTRGSGV